MPSTVISRIVYAPETRILNVWLRVTGKLYRYYEVPPRVHDAFRTARSKGRFFNSHIKERYPFQRVSHKADGGRHAA